MSNPLPYPGLRAFREDEYELFYGRDNYLDSMVERLRSDRFLAVLGPSGSGKSSLVHTGLTHWLKLGYLGKAGTEWTVISVRPDSRPLHNLAAAMAGLMVDGPDQTEIESLVDWLGKGSRGVVEWFQTGVLPAGNNLLLIVDQFEELFRYAGYA